MPQGWRITKEKHAKTAFTGEGAARTGGRWNSRGVAIVYTSSTRALAALESLVHLNPPVLFTYVAVAAEFDQKLVEIIRPDRLPIDWQVEPPSSSTKAIGDDWVRRASAAVLAVPSVLVPEELNYLLNPRHPAFNRMRIGKAERFAFDSRLLG